MSKTHIDNKDEQAALEEIQKEVAQINKDIPKLILSSGLQDKEKMVVAKVQQSLGKIAKSKDMKDCAKHLGEAFKTLGGKEKGKSGFLNSVKEKLTKMCNGISKKFQIGMAYIIGGKEGANLVRKGHKQAAEYQKTLANNKGKSGEIQAYNSSKDKDRLGIKKDIKTILDKAKTSHAEHAKATKGTGFSKNL